MTSMSRLIPVLRGGRARSASPIVSLPAASRNTLRAASPLSAFIDNRNYTTSGLSGSNHGNIGVQSWEKRTSLIRSFSDVALPEPPTSNHPHKPLPGAKGQLIYTETWVFSFFMIVAFFNNKKITIMFLVFVFSDEAPALATFSLLPVLSKVRKDYAFFTTSRKTCWI